MRGSICRGYWGMRRCLERRRCLRWIMRLWIRGGGLYVLEAVEVRDAGEQEWTRRGEVFELVETPKKVIGKCARLMGGLED